MTAYNHPPGSLFHSNNADFLDEVSADIGGLAETALTSSDPDLQVAAHFHVTSATLQRWVLAAGRHSCSAALPRGGNCKRPSGEAPILDPRRWAAASARPCPWHSRRTS